MNHTMIAAYNDAAARIGSAPYDPNQPADGWAVMLAERDLRDAERRSDLAAAVTAADERLAAAHDAYAAAERKAACAPRRAPEPRRRLANARGVLAAARREWESAHADLQVLA